MSEACFSCLKQGGSFFKMVANLGEWGRGRVVGVSLGLTELAVLQFWVLFAELSSTKDSEGISIHPNGTTVG